MTGTSRKLPWVLVGSNHGTLIVNRLDYRVIDNAPAYGVGFRILESAGFPSDDTNIMLQLLAHRRTGFGDGVVAVDCGANIGVYTVEWAKLMIGWGLVIAIEAQERIFYALAGNILINNCHNARAIHAAVGAEIGTMRIPIPDYLSPASFGSLELRQTERNEFIGQRVDYSSDKLSEVRAITVDSLQLKRLDLLKIDVEGMELEVLDGARESIARFTPAIFIEHIKSDKEKLFAFLTGAGYRTYTLRHNTLAVHASDPTSKHIRQN